MVQDHGRPVQAACEAPGLLLLSDSVRRRAAAQDPGVIEALRRGCRGQADAQECGASGCVPISLRHHPFARLKHDDSGASGQECP